jgi:hypothetical protein
MCSYIIISIVLNIIELDKIYNYVLLPPFQIRRRFSFSRYIAFAMHLDIHYGQIHTENDVSLQNPKRFIIWNGESTWELFYLFWCNNKALSLFFLLFLELFLHAVAQGQMPMQNDRFYMRFLPAYGNVSFFTGHSYCWFAQPPIVI